MLKHSKSKNFSAWYTEVVQKAELADLRYNVRGFLVHRWWSVDIMKRMFEAYRKELDRTGHKEEWFPSVIPESNLKKEAEHAEGFRSEVFWVTAAGSGKKELEEPLILRPTSETSMYTMYSYWIRSWRDLPFKRYQSGAMFRYESQTRPFLRGREFYWIEAHDVFSTKEEAEAQVKQDMRMTEKVMYQQFGIPFIFFKRPKWDAFPGAEWTYAADTINPDGRSLQQPSTHMLGQNFARAFNIKFRDKKGEEQYTWQTCYGPAIWRMIASIIALHGDDKGLVLPFNLAPYQIVIVPIYKKSKTVEIKKVCNKIAVALEKAGYRVHFDSNEIESPGSKFNTWEIKGVPVRIEVGPKDIKLNQIVIVQRHTGEKNKIKISKVISYIKRIDGQVLRFLIKRADSLLKSNISEAETFEELKKKMKKGGFVRVNFCSVESASENCSEKIKEELAAEVRGIRVDKNEKASGECVVCGRKAKCVVYIAKQY